MIAERRQTIDIHCVYIKHKFNSKRCFFFFQSQLHCIIKTLLTFFLNVHKANVSKINPNTHVIMHTKHVTVIALASQITREDQNQSVCVSLLTHTNRFSCVSGTSCTTISRRRANHVSQTHSLTSLKADMKLGRSWQAQADRRRRGERGFPKLMEACFAFWALLRGLQDIKARLLGSA